MASALNTNRAPAFPMQARGLCRKNILGRTTLLPAGRPRKDQLTALGSGFPLSAWPNEGNGDY